ncbi:MAG: transposase [candidate division Zixibacteria bacterium]|nr:transposase [candidate division Zixibacteria bacterium]
MSRSKLSSVSTINYEMTNIRRHFKPNDLCFFTHVTYNRKPVLIDHFDLLWASIEHYSAEEDFDLIAWVVLPDHMHMLVETSSRNASDVMKRMKQSFGAKVRSRLKLKSGRMWQYRFWDHIIRDQDDLNQHIDYIHYNPVKHGLAHCPADWSYSSFPQFQKKGIYQPDWGIKLVPDTDGQFGE